VSNMGIRREARGVARMAGNSDEHMRAHFAALSALISKNKKRRRARPDKNERRRPTRRERRIAKARETMDKAKSQRGMPGHAEAAERARWELQDPRKSWSPPARREAAAALRKPPVMRPPLPSSRPLAAPRPKVPAAMARAPRVRVPRAARVPAPRIGRR